MIPIPLANDDDPRFLETVRRIINRTVHHSRPVDVFVVRIDQWFDHKWLGFAGNLYGKVAFRKKRLAIPPFVPNRVVSQYAFRLKERESYCLRNAPSLHRHQRSGENLGRFIDYASESGVFVWFGGDSAHAEYGSMMIYNVCDETQFGWYASFRRNGDWHLYKVVGLSRTELTSMIESETVA